MRERECVGGGENELKNVLDNVYKYVYFLPTAIIIISQSTCLNVCHYTHTVNPSPTQHLPTLKKKKKTQTPKLHLVHIITGVWRYEGPVHGVDVAKVVVILNTHATTLD